ncbi:hypothetical protein SAMN05216196_103398 [Lutimaribacter pacificus]|uniref:Phytase-like domain-containing protein n=1 Tax=Lutimaribacter pacificus TaxID=391948 RepID=A0A1H0GVL7_9RHOB|nr:esterase-like activity of phytase family protein [Lutimaribacter pacificus]SDO10864.1 hypothetical protein SAMN05216196_103398 [Lutimaribacter pacificus]SHJ92403.1 hypothetical protein SAMN05444142_102399 [Lutimaribacter pacificus]
MRLGPARALIAALATLGATAALAEGLPARFLSQFTWAAGVDGFGGLSGIELSDDGLSLTAISDRGLIVTAGLTREGDRITGASLTGMDEIATRAGGRLPDDTRDAEGLAIGTDGTIYVSYEGTPMIARLPPDPAQSGVLPLHPELQAVQHNSGMEALAIDDQGRLYTLPERSGAYDRPFPVWMFAAPRWQMVARLTRDADYLPVGADFGPDGWLYILERGFNGIGFRSRVRRIRPLEGGIQAGEVLLTSAILAHDNLEGISVWRDGQGRVRLTMISDDNFRRLQRTEIVEYVIDKPLQ